MGFSAGGTNVGGVQQTEQGSFVGDYTNTSFSIAGGETQTVDVTVPAGHKYSLKTMSISIGTLVGTISNVSLRIVSASTTKDISIASDSSVPLVLNFTQPYILGAGDKLRFRATSTAWTSGQLNCNYIYQDITL
jgi:hypothetical protein